ncbi:hypothetical protein EST54_29495 [Streptomyces sioyaensis]|uniref:Adenosine deaminase domain-containing protein n=2 Tax=Streptomyces sioyaensis TaxID=67364 RepID=A0A4Q1QIT3_9ACTN|nr:hypothetical protein EST54_29495 [Streptomyces sioyaensis]
MVPRTYRQLPQNSASLRARTHRDAARTSACRPAAWCIHHALATTYALHQAPGPTSLTTELSTSPDANRTPKRRKGTMDLHAFAARLPKCELHAHLAGSVPEPVVRGWLGTDNPSYAFRDFTGFLSQYGRVEQLVDTPDRVHEALAAMVDAWAADHVVHAEVRVGRATLARIGARRLADALDQAAADAAVQGVSLAWIYEFDGAAGLQAADHVVDAALDDPPQALRAVGLSGDESGPERYAQQFRQAASAGLALVPHAGTFPGTTHQIDVALHHGAVRIGHATSAARDPDTLRRLADRQVTVEMSPTSEVMIGAVPGPRQHPLETFLAAGVPVALCADDPALFRTTLTSEYLMAAEHCGQSAEALRALARQAARAALLDEPRRTSILDEIDSRSHTPRS